MNLILEIAILKTTTIYSMSFLLIAVKTMPKCEKYDCILLTNTYNFQKNLILEKMDFEKDLK